MKKSFLLILISLACFTASANYTDSIPANTKDVSSMDGIIAALYDVISGDAGKVRNWDRFRTLFIPEAKLIATGKRPDGTASRRTMSVEDYITTAGPTLEKNGFFEKEISRKTDQFGNVVQLFSTYESRRKADDAKPFVRGINSIQLWFDGNRWWIINILWQSETPEFPIPEKYLK
ncbi:MAG: hypothetical protein QM731_20270 [Chitinophagaceae bacterium]